MAQARDFQSADVKSRSTVNCKLRREHGRSGVDHHHRLVIDHADCCALRVGAFLAQGLHATYHICRGWPHRWVHAKKAKLTQFFANTRDFRSDAKVVVRVIVEEISKTQRPLIMVLPVNITKCNKLVDIIVKK